MEDRAETGFRAAHAEAASAAELATALLAGLGPLPVGANIGFLYATDQISGELPRLLELLREATGIGEWAGTVGLGVIGKRAEPFDKPAASVLVGCLPRDGFRIFGPSPQGLDPAALAWTERRHPTVAFVHADPRQPRLQQHLETLASATPLFLVGGLTATREASVQIAGRPVEGGVSGVLLAPEIGVLTGLSQGCSPIGPTHRITEATENIVLTIDDRPALEVLKEEIGELLSRDLRRIGGLIFAGLPVKGADTGDYLVRNIVGIDPRAGAIAIAAEVADGEPILFCRRDPPSAMKDMRRMLETLHRRLDGRTPKAGLYVSCVARGPNLFGPGAEEAGAIREVLGDFPIAGFFANGEICNDRLYGYTGVLTLFV
jgi:small ligand-binding sensory domain FIST